MNYKSFEDLMSPERLSKYVVACSNNTRKAMVLYRYNLKLSQEMFGVISCFEVVLRNRINRALIAHFGNDWLRDFILPGGQFYYDPIVNRHPFCAQLLFNHSEIVFLDGCGLPFLAIWYRSCNEYM